MAVHGKLSWNYDRYGNRLNQNVTAGTAPPLSVVVDPNTNRITGSTYAYDAAGNMTNDTFHSYAYDAENRLTVVDPQLNPVAATYTYLGALRVKKVAGSTTTVYVYSGTKPVQEYENGSLKREYIYAGSGPMLATVTWNAGTATTTYQHPDHLSIRAESDASGNLIRSTGHFPFGEAWYDTSPGSKWQFTTYERDSESQLDYAMFRAYSSRLGRFMQADRLGGEMGNPESLSRYPYVRNDAVGLVDPLGLFCQEFIGFMMVGENLELVELTYCSIDDGTQLGHGMHAPNLDGPTDPHGGGNGQSSQPTGQQSPPAPPPPPICGKLNRAGNITAGIGGVAFLIGTGLDVTGVGAPAGAILQFGGAEAAAIGGIEVGAGEVCNWVTGH